MKVHLPVPIAVVLAGAVLVAGCGDRPQRVTGASSETQAASPHAPAQAAAPLKAPKFAGRVVLEGELANAKTGAVFLSARRKGQRLPSLSHKYEMNDAGWSSSGASRTLEFALTEADNMGGFGAPLGAEMEVEARYDPDGMIDPTPGAVDPGVVKAAVPASPGDKGLAITLAPPTK